MRAWIGFLLALASNCAATPQEPGAGTVGIQLTSSRLARVPSPGTNDPEVPIENETNFLTTDPMAWFLVTYTGGHKGDKIRVEWRTPQGVVAQQYDHTQLVEGTPVHLAWRLLIAGGPPSFSPGDWQVRLFWNDHSVNVTNFRISTPPPSVIRIASRTVLPPGTAGVPYFLQLVAQGGTPPYQWTALKPFPEGLTMSSSGAITGNPKQRGGFRATVQAKDASGSTVTRTLGIGIGIAIPEERAAVRHLLKSVDPNPCSRSAGVTDFAASDPGVILAALVRGRAGSEGRVEWLNPRGEIALVNRVPKKSDGPDCVVETLPLADRREPGDWRVRLFWRENEMFTLNFHVTGTAASATAAPAPPRGGRFAVVIGNLGYEKLPPPGQAAADLDQVEAALHEDGFEVVRRNNANLESLRQVEQTLSDSLHPGDAVLVYYAGYGVATGGDVWLLPVNFDPGDSRPMQSKAYSVLRLLQFFEDSKANVKFIVLDSAAVAGQPRENAGAVMGEVDESTALVFSTPPGSAPKTGSAPAAVFGRAFAEVLRKPGLDARNVLQIELPKTTARLAPSNSPPLAILGGGAEFVFRAAAARSR
jgi:hypothetical protein